MNESKKNFSNLNFGENERMKVIAYRNNKKKCIFKSAFEDLRNKPDNFWLSRFPIQFIDQNGQMEEASGKGLRTEWFTLLSKAMVNLDSALFKRFKNNDYIFNSESGIN
jgi:hypothetical protein